MILQIDHQHQAMEPPLRRQSLRTQFDASAQIKRQFAIILSKAQARLNNSSISEINRLRELREKKAYANLNISPLQYLFIVFEQRRQHLGSEADTMEGIMKKHHRRVVSDILKQKINIEKQHKSISQIKKELDQSLKAMRLESLQNSFVGIDKEEYKLKQQQKNYQFRSRGYWKEDSTKTEEVKQFLRSIRKKQIQQRSRYRSIANKERQAQERQAQKSTIIREEQRIKNKQQLHNSLIKKQEKKIDQARKQSKKKEQVQVFLAKFKEKPPNYIIAAERYKKRQFIQQRQRQQFLRLLKQSKRHSSLSEIRDEMRKYDEIKALHQAQKQQENMRQQHLREQIQEKLSRMYKSKIHSKSLNQTPAIDSKKAKDQQIIKMQMYSQQVSSLYPPKISEEKRQQLSRDIQALVRRQNHSIIKKHRGGQDIFLNRQQLNPRKVGLQYLEEVKKIANQIQRKPPPTPQKPSQKIIGKSPLKKSFYSKKATISNWKEIMDSPHYTPEEKEEKLKAYFKLIEETRLRQQSQAKHADQRRSLMIQQMTDHYQIERTEAKLALLKSLK